jgi:hypothetical protein
VAGVVFIIFIAGVTAFVRLGWRQRRQHMVPTTAGVPQGGRLAQTGVPTAHFAPPFLYPSVPQNTADPVVYPSFGHRTYPASERPLVPYPITSLAPGLSEGYAHRGPNPLAVTPIYPDHNQDAFFASTQPASSAFTYAQAATGAVGGVNSVVIGQGSTPRRRDATFSPPPPYHNKS